MLVKFLIQILVYKCTIKIYCMIYGLLVFKTRCAQYWINLHKALILLSCGLWFMFANLSNYFQSLIFFFRLLKLYIVSLMSMSVVGQGLPDRKEGEGASFLWGSQQSETLQWWQVAGRMVKPTCLALLGNYWWQAKVWVLN